MLQLENLHEHPCPRCGNWWDCYGDECGSEDTATCLDCLGEEE